MIERNVHLIAAVAAEKNKSSQLDLMMGFHPEEKRLLTEDEENLNHIIPLIGYVSMESIVAGAKSDPLCRDALLWVKCFPQIKQFATFRGDELHTKLWESALRESTVLHLAYAFYPKSATIDRTAWDNVNNAAKTLQHHIDKSLATDIRTKGKTCWTLPFPAESSLGKIIEGQAGLGKDIKARIGVTNYAPGLLCNYLLHRNKSIEEVLDPYQFEELAGMIFTEEGWKVTITQKSRDGGKDVIAQKEINNKLIIAYIQAKLHKEKNKVGITKVKEFVATVAGDKVDKGYIVATSPFSKPAKQWLQEKGIDLATVELIDRQKLLRLMEDIAVSKIPAYLKI
ncbi:MAG: hypothetical protein HKUEN01_35050 [Candidatus Kuenenia stuttgartiensis]|nr:MAG: hypothetical protein HKUEN01_35050 [Candidatus Kuenenia stuttgartiensis]